MVLVALAATFAMLNLELGIAGAQPLSEGTTTSVEEYYTYDSGGRLVRANYGTAGALSYQYDALGNMRGAAPGAGSVFRFSYLPIVMRHS